VKAPWRSEQAAFGFLLWTAAVCGAIVVAVLLVRAIS
jgi:hypothetical protein